MYIFDKLKQALKDSGSKESKDRDSADAPTITTTVEATRGPEPQDSQKVRKEKQHRSKKMKKFLNMVKENEKSSDKSGSSLKRRGTGSVQRNPNPQTPSKFVESIKAIRRKKKTKDDKSENSVKPKFSQSQKDKVKDNQSRAKLRSTLRDPNTLRIARKKKNADGKDSHGPKKISQSEKYSKTQTRRKGADEAELAGEKAPPKLAYSTRSRTKSVYVAPELRRQPQPDSEEQSTKFEILTVASRPAISNNRKKRHGVHPMPTISMEILPTLKGKASAEVADVEPATAMLPVTVTPSSSSDGQRKRSEPSVKDVDVSKKNKKSVSKVVIKEKKAGEPSVKTARKPRRKANTIVKKTSSAPVLRQGQVKPKTSHMAVITAPPAVSVMANWKAETPTPPEVTPCEGSHSTSSSKTNSSYVDNDLERSEPDGDAQSMKEKSADSTQEDED